MIVLTVVFSGEKNQTSNGSNFGWLIRQMSTNQKSGWQTFRRSFVSGSVFFSLCPPERYYKAKRKLSLISGYHSGDKNGCEGDFLQMDIDNKDSS